MLDVQAIRQQFPLLKQSVHGHPLVYLDNAATSQKPESVIQSLVNYYSNHNANVHRGLHELSIRASDLYDGTRDKVAGFIGANNSSEIVYTSGATESINLVARCFIEAHFQVGDAVVLTEMEHHSNLVPWQILANKIGLDIRYLAVDEKGQVDISQLPNLLQDGRVKLASFCWISNSLGTVNPVAEMIQTCQQYEVPVMLDACQVPAHQRIDVQQLGSDFIVFSGHKMFAPTGIGILWAKQALLEKFDYWQGGGDMIIEVGFDDFSANDIPYRFEAGTPAIAQVVGLGAAIDWLASIDLEQAYQHEQNLLAQATNALSQIKDLQIVGQAEHKSSVLSFVLTTNRLHPSDIATLLNLKGIAVRSGHHCTMPILKKMGWQATARASFSFYNTQQEVEQFSQGLADIVKKFA